LHGTACRRWPAGYDGRAIVNDFCRQWHGREKELEQNLGHETETYWKAARAGDTSKTVVFAGEGLDFIHDIRLAGDIVHAIAAQAEQLLERRGGVENS
jgi:nitronate monooxygenase